ncbi:MAG: hypothetical protein VB061_06935 [Christensenella sp.]|nr:hypothetical protein [Christensenella sp.]
MNDTKIIKTICAQTGKYFALEVKKIDDAYRVVNMVELSGDEADHIASEIRLKEIRSADNLLPCYRCGSRKVMGCSCARDSICAKGTPYRFQCLYCDEMCFDYTGVKVGGPYTQWAGISNIPDAAKDRFGNAQGSQYDLAQDGGFQGYKIVIVQADISVPRGDIRNTIAALNKKGFQVSLYMDIPSLNVLSHDLEDSCQFWFISDRYQRFSEQYYRLIEDYFNQGFGLYLWGDNEPFYFDTNILCSRIFHTNMTGDSRGTK